MDKIGSNFYYNVKLPTNNLSENSLKKQYFTLLSAEVVMYARIELPLRII